MESLVKNRLASLEMNIEAQRANYEASKEAKIASLLEESALKRAISGLDCLSVGQLLLAIRLAGVGYQCRAPSSGMLSSCFSRFQSKGSSFCSAS